MPETAKIPKPPAKDRKPLEATGMLCMGFTVSEVAKRLKLAESTVEAMLERGAGHDYRGGDRKSGKVYKAPYDDVIRLLGEGLSKPEVAAALGVNLVTIYRRLRAADKS